MFIFYRTNKFSLSYMLNNKKVGENVRVSSGFPLFEKPICINVTLTTILSAESLSSFARISIKFLQEGEVYLSVINPIQTSLTLAPREWILLKPSLLLLYILLWNRINCAAHPSRDRANRIFNFKYMAGRLACFAFI